MTTADYILLGILVLAILVGGFFVIRLEIQRSNEYIKTEKAKYRFFTLASDELEGMRK